MVPAVAGDESGPDSGVPPTEEDGPTVPAELLAEARVFDWESLTVRSGLHLEPLRSVLERARLGGVAIFLRQ